MRIVYDEIGLELRHIILNGDGTFPETKILESICKRYNRTDGIILYPGTSFKNKKGLSVLDAIKHYLYLNNRYRNFIFIVDGEYISQDPISKVKQQLENSGFAVNDEIITLQKAFLITGSSGHNIFNLYCVIWGPETCIEEELIDFIKSTANIHINIPTGPRNGNWCKNLKRERKNKISNRRLKQLLKDAEIRTLESSFPNICAVLREVEKNF